MENLPINAETINKTIDIIDESTEKTRKQVDESAAKGISKVFQLIEASPIGRAIDVYIAERPYKLEIEMEKMRQKYEKIPQQYRVEPSSYIALKAVNELNYSLEEEHLKEMFQNLLISDMDSRKKSNVLPSYIEIIKQLSEEDARFLKLLYSYNEGEWCSIELNVKTQNVKGYHEVGKYAIYEFKKVSETSKQFSTLKLNPLIIDTLMMHRMIEVDYTFYYTRSTAEDEYNTLFDSVKSTYKLSENEELSFEKGVLRLTEFGRNFVNICI